jgi:hypothetical protein
MSTAQSEVEYGSLPVAKKTDIEVVAGTSLVSGLAGAGGFVLAILGLSGLYPDYMLTVATICVGAALLFFGGAIAARHSRLMKDLGAGRLGVTEVWSGVTAEFLGGAAGIVLGVLGLLGMDPMILSASAAIVFGAVLLLGTGVLYRLNDLSIRTSGADLPGQELARDAVKAGIEVQALVGMAGITLGILALVGLFPLVLGLISMLSIGFSVLLSDSALGGRMLSLLRR